MSRRVLIGLVLIAASLAVGAVATAPTSVTTVSFRVTAPVENLAATPGCPGGRTRTPIRSPAGRRIGRSTVCVRSASKRDRPGYVVYSVTERVVETDVLPRGTVVSRATHVFRFNRDGSRSWATIRGRVAGGTGSYEGATGTISGAGPFKRGERLLPNVRIELRLTDLAALGVSIGETHRLAIRDAYAASGTTCAPWQAAPSGRRGGGLCPSPLSPAVRQSYP